MNSTVLGFPQNKGNNVEQIISITLLTLLKHAKKPHADNTWQGVAKALAPIHTPNPPLADVMEILFMAYEEALFEPRFELSKGTLTALATLLAPIKGSHAIDWPTLQKGSQTLCTVEQFYNAIVKSILGQFLLTRVDWHPEFNKALMNSSNQAKGWRDITMRGTLPMHTAHAGGVSCTTPAMEGGTSDAARLHYLREYNLSRLRLLSQRELAVAKQYSQGYSHKEVARQLDISPATVRNFLQRIFTKLEIRDKAELAALVAQASL